MIKRIIAAAAAASFMMASVASAATLAEITSSSGKVLVNKGEGFVPVTGFTSLNAGDRVMVGTEGSAQISYANGCTVTAAPASMVVVPDKAPCADGESMAAAGDVMIQPTAGAFGIPPAVLLIGGAVIVGTIVVASGALSDDDDAPVSAP